MVCCKVGYCVTVRAGIRQKVSAESVVSEVWAPDAICIGHIAQAKALKRQTYVSILPALSQGFGDSSDGAVPNAFTGRIGVIR